MQSCTRTCAGFQSLNAISKACVLALVLLLMCSGIKADEPADAQSVSKLDENQDPGRHPTRSVPVADSQATGLININSATVEQLATALPGIGPAKAQRIVDWRNNNGVFQFLDQLLEVNGIGPKTLEQIAPFIQLGAAGEAVSVNPMPQRDAEHRWVLLDIVDRANKDAARVMRQLAGG